MQVIYEDCLFDLDLSYWRELFWLAYDRIYKTIDENYLAQASVSRGLFRQCLKRKIGTYLGHPYIREPYLDFAYRVLKDLSSPIVVDVGANIGATVLPIAKKIPAAKLFAIEPHPHALSRLLHNQKANHLSNVVSISAAVGTTHGFLELVTDSKNDGGHSIADLLFNPSLESLCVGSVSLKKVFQDFKLSHCDLLKIDTEGFDEQVLHSLEELAAPDKIRHIVVECNPEGLKKFDQSPWDLVSFGLDRGYTCRLLQTQKMITTKQDIPHIPERHVVDFLFV